jgi:hypothetical protein
MSHFHHRQTLKMSCGCCSTSRTLDISHAETEPPDKRWKKTQHKEQKSYKSDPHYVSCKGYYVRLQRVLHKPDLHYVSCKGYYVRLQRVLHKLGLFPVLHHSSTVFSEVLDDGDDAHNGRFFKQPQAVVNRDETPCPPNPCAAVHLQSPPRRVCGAKSRVGARVSVSS